MARTEQPGFTTVCPNCGKETEQPREYLDSAHLLDCPRCGHRFRLGGEQLKAAEEQIRRAEARIDEAGRGPTG